MKRAPISRREFAKSAAAAATVFSSTVAWTQADKRVFRVGLLGCGGRGNGALDQHMEASRILNAALNLGIEIKVVATADWFKDRAEGTGRRFDVPRDRCFGGPQSYKDIVESDLDILLMGAPPYCRPAHFEAAVKAGKHVFMEKPVAVDPPGCRTIIAAGEMAKQKNLMVIAGTQRRHEKGYIETQAACAEGAIGRILGGRVSWCQGHIFANRPLNPRSLSDLVGNWFNWTCLSGDHIVEQHVHNLDIMNWFLGTHPVAAHGFGGRARRCAGNQYDFFSVDFEFPQGVHIHSMCRQVGGCWEWVGEHLIGEKGQTECGGGLRPKTPVVPEEIPQHGGGHLQEHINMLYYLVKGTIINEARNVAYATAAAIMGREAAYTGRRIEWKAMLEDPHAQPDLYNLRMKPSYEEIENGTGKLPKENEIPHAGVPA